MKPTSSVRRASGARDQTASVRQRINAFNRDRRPELVDRKYRSMQSDVFVFFRGTAHLFWEDWPLTGNEIDDAPLTWCCGDLHLENFGSYRGDNGLAHFDLNDFDDAALAPATRDPARLITSVRLAGESLGLARSVVAELETAFLDGYFGALAAGKARWVERAIATGMIRDLLRSLRTRTRKQLIESRTMIVKGHRRFRIDDRRTYALSSRDRKRVVDCVGRFAAHRPNPEFYRVLDVAGRIAGTGSLGIPRYVVLVHGPGGGRLCRILDLKEARVSALTLYAKPTLAASQPSWRDEAERVMKLLIRNRAQILLEGGDVAS